MTSSATTAPRSTSQATETTPAVPEGGAAEPGEEGAHGKGSPADAVGGRRNAAAGAAAVRSRSEAARSPAGRVPRLPPSTSRMTTPSCRARTMRASRSAGRVSRMPMRAAAVSISAVSRRCSSSACRRSAAAASGCRAACRRYSVCTSTQVRSARKVDRHRSTAAVTGSASVLEAGELLLGAGEVAGGLPLEQGREQLVLRAEARVEGAAGEPAAAADVLDAGRGETDLGERLQGGVQQPLDGLGATPLGTLHLGRRTSRCRTVLDTPLHRTRPALRRPPHPRGVYGHKRRRPRDRSAAEGGGDDGLGLLLHLGEVLGPAEGLGVDLVDVLGARRAARRTRRSRCHLEAADRGVVARRPGQLRGDRLAGQLGGGTSSGESFPAPPSPPALPPLLACPGAFCSGPGRRCGRRRLPEVVGQLPVQRRGRPARSRPGSRSASSASRMPSLSVVQTPPSRRRNDAPADSSPPKPTDPSSRPGTNHLNPTGTSMQPCGPGRRPPGRSASWTPASCRRRCPSPSPAGG